MPPPTDPFTLGLAALTEGRPAAALPLLEAAADGSSDVRVWTALGACRWQLQDKARGLAAFARAVELAPGDATAHYNFAVALNGEGRKAKALEEARLALRSRPDHQGGRALLHRLRAELQTDRPRPLTGAVLLNPDALFLSDTETTTVLLKAVSPPPPAPRRLSILSSPVAPLLPDFDALPMVTVTLIALNCLVFWLMERAGGSTDREVMIAYGAQFRPLVEQGQLWRLMTAMFVHAGTGHIFWNMLFFALSARWVEPFFGRLRFLLLYLAAGFVGNLMTLILVATPTAGASGAVLGVIAARITMGFLHADAIPDALRRKFGWWPLAFGLWIIYSGFHNSQTNNIAHVAGFLTGLILAALLAPIHRTTLEPSFRTWMLRGVTATVLAYSALGLAWSVVRGVDESQDLRRAKTKFAMGKLDLNLVPYEDPQLRYTLIAPRGWPRNDAPVDDNTRHAWTSPMAEAVFSITPIRMPKELGGQAALYVENRLISDAVSGQKNIRILSRGKRSLSGYVGGRIVQEITDKQGKGHRVFCYFVPIDDHLFILSGDCAGTHVAKYTPIFDTMAASFRAR